MDCSICFEAYDDGSRVPKQLSCGHSLCARCATACADSESRLRCPQCQKVTLAPENTFTTNYELLNFLMICKANQQKKRVTFVRQEANDSTDLLRNSLKLVKAFVQRIISYFEYLEEKEESRDSNSDDVILWQIATIRAIVITLLVYSSVFLITTTLSWIKLLLSNLIMFIVVAFIVAYIMRYHYHELIYSPFVLNCRIFLNQMISKWNEFYT